MMFGIKVSGTHAHAFVSSFISLNQLHTKYLKSKEGQDVNFLDLVLRYRAKFDEFGLRGAATNEGELAAFTGYAQAFPTYFLALVDTYDTLGSGVLNFLIVALALNEV